MDGRFIPAESFVEEQALSYPLGRMIYERLISLQVPVKVMKPGQRPEISGRNPTEVYSLSKKILVVRVRKEKEFSPCRPSAHFQLPLATSCPGLCQYCYLQTRLGPRPYMRVYANLEEILEQAGRLIARRSPEVTIFEGAATSDPVPIEHITGSLRRAVEFFGEIEESRFRFVTKFSDVAPLLGARHGGKTTIRFSVNTPHVLRYEYGTASLEDRLNAARIVRKDGYRVGLMIGPVITFEGWKEEYASLLERVYSALCGASENDSQGLPFEIITHRFTSRAKSSILSVFPGTTLPLDEADRRLVHGQFGYAKYVYPKATMDEVRNFFENEIARRLPGATIEYVV